MIMVQVAPETHIINPPVLSVCSPESCDGKDRSYEFAGQQNRNDDEPRWEFGTPRRLKGKSRVGLSPPGDADLGHASRTRDAMTKVDVAVLTTTGMDTKKDVRGHNAATTTVYRYDKRSNAWLDRSTPRGPPGSPRLWLQPQDQFDCYGPPQQRGPPRRHEFGQDRDRDILQRDSGYRDCRSEPRMVNEVTSRGMQIDTGQAEIILASGSQANICKDLAPLSSLSEGQRVHLDFANSTSEHASLCGSVLLRVLSQDTGDVEN